MVVRIPGVTPTTSPLNPVSSLSSLSAVISALSPSSIKPESQTKVRHYTNARRAHVKSRPKMIGSVGNLYSRKVLDLQETPGCNIPKEGETASPSQRSLCAAFAWAGRWFPRLRGARRRRLYRMNTAPGHNTEGKRASPSASVLACLVVLFVVSQILHGWRQSETWISKCITSCHSIHHLVVPAGSMYVVFSSVTHFPAAMTCKYHPRWRGKTKNSIKLQLCRQYWFTHATLKALTRSKTQIQWSRFTENIVHQQHESALFKEKESIPAWCGLTGPQRCPLIAPTRYNKRNNQQHQPLLSLYVERCWSWPPLCSFSLLMELKFRKFRPNEYNLARVKQRDRSLNEDWRHISIIIIPTLFCRLFDRSWCEKIYE